MELTIRNDPNRKYAPPRLLEPTPRGYIYVGAVVDPPDRIPIVRGSARRDAVLARLKESARRLEARADVVKATVFRAVLIPPVPGGPRFDAAVLIETAVPEAIPDVRRAEPYRRLIDAAGEPRVMTARNIKRIGDVAEDRQGVFLFNHFTAEDAGVAARLWEHLAGWYVAETGLDNSVLLEPTDAAPYVFVNHARWDGGLVRFAIRQFAKPSFARYVRGNLRANKVVAMPVLFALA
ncbi:MAG TPA: hypothetical protein VF069_24470 [Streptosporangiaceae bacterium]